MINQAKHQFRLWRWQVRRWQSAQQHGKQTLAQLPVIFGNAMPKSGSHLLTQVLHGFTTLGAFVDNGMPPVNRSENNLNLTETEIVGNLRRLQAGDIAYGYLHAREPYTSILMQGLFASLFIYRDPRDVIVSHVFYATDMYTGHGLHQYYNEELSSMEERINAAIRGVTEQGFELSSIRQKYEQYLPWLATPAILSLRFEDLILDREQKLGEIVNFVTAKGLTLSCSHTQAVELLKQAIEPKRSGTFRKGQPGNWQEHFTAENIAIFKEQTGDLLQKLRYEEDENWS